MFIGTLTTKSGLSWKNQEDKLTDFSFFKFVSDITWRLCATPDHLVNRGIFLNKKKSTLNFIFSVSEIIQPKG